MDKPLRILQIFGEPLANGGQESFIMNMYRNIDRDEVQFDFFTPFSCENLRLKQEIDNLGGRVWFANKPFDANKNKYVNQEVRKFLKNHKYDIVHIHSGSTYSLMIVAKIARISGVKNVIVHSHCGGFKNLKYRIIKLLSRPYFMKYPTKYFACSNLAAEWKFPNKIIKDKNYVVLKNAIDTTKLFYSEDIRIKTRENLNLNNKFVVGHIGRFSIQKNHHFLIDIFDEIQKINKDSILLLIGVGELQEEIKEKVKILKLQDKVLFLNLRDDIQELLNAMDVFVLPSFFEGLPVVGVEAQSTGLQVFTSTEVTKELPIEELSFYYSMEEPAKEWAEKIINEYKKYTRKNTTESIKKAGYEVKNATEKMKDLYLEMND